MLFILDTSFKRSISEKKYSDTILSEITNNHLKRQNIGISKTSELAGWSAGKDTPELKASLDRIRKAADELITTIDGHLAELQKEKAWEHLTADDVRNIQCIDSQYFPVIRTAEHTLTCEIHGEPVKLFYEVSKHDDGEGFTIHSDGKDIWDLMPEPELRKLEPVLSQAVTFAGWQKELEQAETAAAVRDVRYGLYETEYLNMSREQISALHEAIDRKEAALTAAEGPFRYYSTQRPVDIETFPKPPDNKIVEIVNFDKRIPVENETMRAWGYIEYQKPLTEQQADDYELRPAPANRSEKISVLEDLKDTKPSSRDANVTRKPKKQKEETR